MQLQNFPFLVSSTLLVHATTASPFYPHLTSPVQTPPPTVPDLDWSYIPPELKRQITTELSTCGYLDGDPTRFRTADKGFNCRIDTEHGLWGFCPTTVIQATDCGLAGNCVDSSSCSSGCGITRTPGITTFTCATKSFCSTALLTFGIDQTYSYIACGPVAKTDHLLITPTSDTSLSKTSTTSSSVESSLSASTSSTTSFSSASSSPSSTNVSTLAFGEQSSSTSTPSAENNAPIIVGGVLGGVALVAFTILGSIYLLRRNRREKRSTASQDPTPPPPPHAKSHFLGGYKVEYSATPPPAELGGRNNVIQQWRASRGPVELPN